MEVFFVVMVRVYGEEEEGRTGERERMTRKRREKCV